MFRRLLVVLSVALVAAIATPVALGARVHVRVEGKTQTIFGATQPVVNASNALEALEAASVAAEFHYNVVSAAFGRYVDQIGRYKAEGQTGWVFKVNGVSPPVGADAVTLKDGDVVLWYWAQFGVAGGPRTLELVRRSTNCYRVSSVDDKGARTAAAGAVLLVDGRRVRTRAGAACVGRHRGLVRAVLGGAVRSNALR